MIAWCGSRADGLGWLSNRCVSNSHVEFASRISTDSIDAICNQNPHRLVLSVENRLDYPQLEIQHLRRHWPEVPFALALGAWFDGSRRTGIGSTSHLSLPWYRWWDGWQKWLTGSNSALLNPWPQSVDSRSNREPDAVAWNPSGIIVCDCRDTATTWQVGLECDPVGTQVLTLQSFRSRMAKKSPIADPDWVLWDDSCLATSIGADCLSSVTPFFSEIRRTFPCTRILAATCMPRWADWHQWESAGANELIVKPNLGFALRDVYTKNPKIKL